MKYKIWLGLVLIVLFSCLGLQAQEMPPRPMKVTTYQHLAFGAFINGFGGGTVTISAQGARSYTGSIYLVNMGMAYNSSIFRVEALPGNIIHVYFPGVVTLSGSNGGEIDLNINSCYPATPFINSSVPPFYTEVQIGGTLSIGSPLDAPAGNYYGTFSVTFMQE